MSLLLDALKKSEDERREQEIASLRNLPRSAQTTRPSARSWTVPALALVALCGAGFFGYSQFAQRSATQELALKTAETQRLNAAKARDAARRQARSGQDAAALREEMKAQTLSAAQRPTSNEALMQALGARSNPEIIQNSATRGAVVPLPSPAASAREGTPLPSTFSQPSAPEKLTQGSKQATSAPDKSVKPEGASAEKAEINAARSDPSLPAAPSPPATPLSADEGRWRAMPRAYNLAFGTRQTLPNTTMNMHVYASDPEQRVVMINMESAREGGLLKTGLQVKEITPLGAVVEFQGQEFFIDP